MTLYELRRRKLYNERQSESPLKESLEARKSKIKDAPQPTRWDEPLDAPEIPRKKTKELW